MILSIKKERASHLQEGFTIIEILIVLALIVGFLAAVGPNLYRLAFGGKQDTTRTIVKNVQQSLELYKLHTNKYPEKLADLYKRPAEEKKWQGPYLNKEEDPRDAWDIKLQYKRTPGGKHAYELFSYGSEEGSETPVEQRIDVWQI